MALKHRYWRIIQISVINSHAPRCCEYRWRDKTGNTITPNSYSTFGSFLDADSASTTAYDGLVNDSDQGWITADTGGISADFGSPGYSFEYFGAYVSYNGARGANFDIQYSDDNSTWITCTNINFNAAEYGWHDFNTEINEYFINKINGVAIENIKKLNGLRPDDNYTKLLLHCEGADGSTTFIDEIGHTITPNGAVQIDTADKKFGSASALFDGNADYLSIASNADFAFGTGAFTVEFWFRINSINRLHILYSHGGSNELQGVGGVFTVGPDNKVHYYCDGYRINGTNVLSINTWYHMAIVGNGGANGSRNIKMFINGTQEGSTYTYDYNFGERTIYLGANEDSLVVCLYGWIDEFRISKGIQRWTTNFTPPNSEYRQIKKFMGVSNI